MEQVKTALRTLTMKVCQELDGQEIPKKSIRTVVYTPDAPPHVAMDFDRPAISDLRYSITIEYSIVMSVIEPIIRNAFKLRTWSPHHFE